MTTIGQDGTPAHTLTKHSSCLASDVHTHLVSMDPGIHPARRLTLCAAAAPFDDR